MTESTARSDLTSALAPTLFDELRWRGMLSDSTAGLAERLARGPISLYNGFDPTGDSLHVGHLVPVFGLLHFQRHGNRPVVVVGGGTGMIGDPSGASAERNLLDEATLAHNVAGIGAQLRQFLDFGDGPAAARVVNNLDWLREFGLIEFLRDIGKHFTVPYMLSKDSVQLRIDSGLSFTEFSYMLLQSADYLHLFRELGVELQTGGADQWGNITAGLELIRKVEPAAEVHALSYPLLTDSSGKKFGKTSGNTSVWLDPARTSPYAFYQYWIDRPDGEMSRLLRIFTLFDEPTVTRLEAELAATPETRPAQKALAYDITARVHGVEAAREAAARSTALFSGKDDGVALVPDLRLPADALATATDFAVRVGAASSRSEARRLIEQGGFYVNGERVLDTSGPIAAPARNPFKVGIGKKRVVIVELDG